MIEKVEEWKECMEWINLNIIKKINTYTVSFY